MALIDLDDEAPAQAADTVKTTRLAGSLRDATGVLVLDVSNLAWRSSYGNPDLQNSRGEFTGHVFGSFRTLLGILQNYLPAGSWLPVFCYDGEHAKDERRQVVPTYKANRDSSRFNPVPGVSEFFKHLPGLHVRHPRREGDDAMAWVVMNMKRGERQLVVFSGDKDSWTLLQYPGVRVLSPNLDRFVTLQDVEKEFFTTPDRVPLAKAFFGDPSDGVKGVERLVRKQAAPFLNQAPEPNPAHVYASLKSAFVREENAWQTAPTKDQKKEAKKKAVSLLKLCAKLEPEYARVCDNFKVLSPNTTDFSSENTVFTTGNREELVAGLEKAEARTLLDRIDDYFGAEMFLQHDG